MLKTHTIKAFRFLLIISLFLYSISFSQELHFVKRVVDGDTFILANNERVRLIGINTPETVHPSKPVEYFGKEASAFTKKMIEGKKIMLEYDVQKKDRYGRILAYVYLKDIRFIIFVNLKKVIYFFYFDC